MWIIVWLALWGRLQAHYAGPWVSASPGTCERHTLTVGRCPGHPLLWLTLPGIGTDIACSRCGFVVHLGM